MILYDFLNEKGDLRKVMTKHHVTKDGFIAECIRIHRLKPHTVNYEFWRIQGIKKEGKFHKSFCKSGQDNPDAKAVTVGYF